MPTDISVTSTTSRRAPGRLWLGSPHGVDAPIHVTFDFATFTHANFTATGQIQNGCLLGKITASEKYGPYDDTATDGRQTAVCALYDDQAIPTDTSRVITSAAVPHFQCITAGLPYKTGPGALDANARVDLRMVIFRD